MKIAVVGKGTAGVLAFNHLKHYTDAEVICYYTSNKKEQSVGEGSQLFLPQELYKTLGLEFHDVQELFDATYKKAIKYEGFGKTDYYHTFEMPNLSIHFNAVKLQKYIFDKYESNFVEKYVQSYDQIDADYIVDCTGQPNDFEDHNIAEYIPVNTAVVKQCYVTKPFDYTLTKARPYGWVFAIPLQNRVSFGYLYDRSINTNEEVEDDLNRVIKELKYTPFTDAKTIEFNNYYRKNNYEENVFFNGNASFFLEPMEATSLTTVDKINRTIFDIIYRGKDIKDANNEYQTWFKEVQDIITMHYLPTPKYDTEFWKTAKEKATNCWSNPLPRLVHLLNNINDPLFYMEDYYGTWYKAGFLQNMKGLGINYVK